MAVHIAPEPMAAAQSQQGPQHPGDLLIGAAYEVELSQKLPLAGGGLPAFAVRDHRQRRSDLMAVQVAPGTSARSVALNALAGIKIDHMLLPLAHGSGAAPGGGQAYYVITPQPQGTPLLAVGIESLHPWSERDLLNDVLRPAAIALDRLANCGVTHRAIRLSNLFHSRSGQPITLGCAWAGAPASLQSALFEPPYAAMCHPAGRGDGTIADDVYALGVLLMTLAAGRVPLADLDNEAIIRLKLERGSYAALVGDIRLPPIIAELTRGMLAEDPEHRPPPLLLADPIMARARRVAARPPQRAQRPLEIGALPAWDARMLGYAIARAPEHGVPMLRSLTMENWLRRTLGDPGLASRIEEVVRLRTVDHAADPTTSDLVLVARAVAILDPLAPLVWRDVVLFPDGIGSLLAHAGSDPTRNALPEVIEAVMQSEAIGIWAEARPGRCEPAELRLDTRLHRLLLRIPGWSGGLARLRYTLNPLLPCRSPLLGGDCVVRMHDLLPALERHTAASVDFVIDREIAAFISAHFNGRMDADFVILAQNEDPDIDPPGHRGLAQLRVLGRLAATNQAKAWPCLAALALRSARLALAQWRSRKLRGVREQALVAAAGQGALVAMLSVLEDPHAREVDGRAALSGMEDIRAIAGEISWLAAQSPMRAQAARNTGQEIAAALGVVALAASAVMTALL
jgi:hypothetical protein